MMWNAATWAQVAEGEVLLWVGFPQRPADVVVVTWHEDHVRMAWWSSAAGEHPTCRASWVPEAELSRLELVSPGRWRWHVAGFPVPLEVATDAASAPRVLFPDARHRRKVRVKAAALELGLSGVTIRAHGGFRSALEAPEEPWQDQWEADWRTARIWQAALPV